MKSILILVAFIVFWLVFAIIKEKSDQEHAYAAAKVGENDSLSSALRKVRYCMTYEVRTIKWRRALMSAAIATILLFLLCWQRLPTPQEIITHMLVMTAVFSAVWSNFAAKTSTAALQHCDNNISNIKKLLKQHRNFILPSSW